MVRRGSVRAQVRRVRAASSPDRPRRGAAGSGARGGDARRPAPRPVRRPARRRRRDPDARTPPSACSWSIFTGRDRPSSCGGRLRRTGASSPDDGGAATIAWTLTRRPAWTPPRAEATPASGLRCAGPSPARGKGSYPADGGARVPSTPTRTRTAAPAQVSTATLARSRRSAASGSARDAPERGRQAEAVEPGQSQHAEEDDQLGAEQRGPRPWPGGPGHGGGRPGTSCSAGRTPAGPRRSKVPTPEKPASPRWSASSACGRRARTGGEQQDRE